MKLNPDCVRDVLLAVESCDFEEHLNLDKLSAKLPDHTYEDLWYTCLKLEEGCFLTLFTVDMPRSYRPGIKCIVDLTYQGHEFLNTVRDENRWKKVKGVANAIGNYSLSAIQSIAEGVTSAGITALIQAHHP